MKKSLTIFLQITVVLVGIGVLAFMLWEPQFEGRNAQATFFEIYFQDLFLSYAYLASSAFFIALYQVFKLLKYVRENKTYSQANLQALQAIKFCAITLMVLAAAPVAYLFIVRPGEDIAGGVAIGFFIIFISIFVAIVATVFQRSLQKAVEIKSENSLRF